MPKYPPALKKVFNIYWKELCSNDLVNAKK